MMKDAGIKPSSSKLYEKEEGTGYTVYRRVKHIKGLNPDLIVDFKGPVDTTTHTKSTRQFTSALREHYIIQENRKKRIIAINIIAVLLLIIVIVFLTL